MLVAHLVPRLWGRSCTSSSLLSRFCPCRDHYTPKDSESIPTGEILPVKGTPFDFGSPHSIASRLSQVPGGYDHNFVLQGLGKQAKFKVHNQRASER